MPELLISELLQAHVQHHVVGLERLIDQHLEGFERADLIVIISILPILTLLALHWLQTAFDHTHIGEGVLRDAEQRLQEDRSIHYVPRLALPLSKRAGLRLDAGLFEDVFYSAHEVNLAILEAIQLFYELLLDHHRVELWEGATLRLEMAVDVEELWHEFHQEDLKSVDRAAINEQVSDLGLPAVCAQRLVL